MVSNLKVLGIAGSLRKASYNRALLRAAQELAPEGMTIEIYEGIGDIPLYNGDVEAQGFPEPVERFKKAIREADALFVVTPEYNWGVPGVLKNAIDWASRPSKDAVFKGKPLALTGASMGMAGTLRSQIALRQTFLALSALLVQGPEVLVARAQEKFDEAGHLTDETTRKMVRQLLEALRDWALRLQPR